MMSYIRRILTRPNVNPGYGLCSTVRPSAERITLATKFATIDNRQKRIIERTERTTTFV